MPWRKNKFFVEKHQKLKIKNVKIEDVRRGKHYRKELEPFIGELIGIKCTKFTYKKSFFGDAKCIKILLRAPEIVKIPTMLSEVEIPTVSHIWIMVDTTFETDINNATCLLFKGFPYRYVHCGYENIGFKVISMKCITR